MLGFYSGCYICLIVIGIKMLERAAHTAHGRPIVCGRDAANRVSESFAYLDPVRFGFRGGTVSTYKLRWGAVTAHGKSVFFSIAARVSRTT